MGNPILLVVFYGGCAGLGEILLNKFHYFVSYTYADKNGRRGYGNCTIVRKERIIGMKHIKEITKKIEWDRRLSEGSVIILNYQRFGAE